MDEFLRQLDKSGVQQSVQASLNTTFNVEQIMHPESAKALFGKIGFESTACDEADQKQGRRRKRKTKTTRKKSTKKQSAAQKKPGTKKEASKKRAAKRG
jgi:hypothetical protein